MTITNYWDFNPYICIKYSIKRKYMRIASYRGVRTYINIYTDIETDIYQLTIFYFIET